MHKPLFVCLLMGIWVVSSFRLLKFGYCGIVFEFLFSDLSLCVCGLLEFCCCFYCGFFFFSFLKGFESSLALSSLYSPVWLKLVILLPQLPKYWECRYATSPNLHSPTYSSRTSSRPQLMFPWQLSISLVNFLSMYLSFGYLLLEVPAQVF